MKPGTSGRSSGYRVYRLRFLGRAVDDLSGIDGPHQRIIREKLLILAENPEALKNNIRRLNGDVENLFRLRVGSYRVIFRKDKRDLIILIVRIGHRKDIYQSLN